MYKCKPVQVCFLIGIVCGGGGGGGGGYYNYKSFRNDINFLERVAFICGQMYCVFWMIFIVFIICY